MAAPANDDMANAQLLSAYSGSVSGTTVDATNESPYEPFDFMAGDTTGTVWYKIAVPINFVSLSVTMTLDDAPTGGAYGVAAIDALNWPMTGDVDFNDYWLDQSLSGPADFETDSDIPTNGVWYIGVGSDGGHPFTLTWEMVGVEGRVSIALNDNALNPSPTWTRIDTDDKQNLVSRIEITRGRQTELDITDTSTATVHINDTQGLFDPTNTSSPYFDKLIGRQILLQVYSPVTETWIQQTRMWVHDITYEIHPATDGGSSILSNVQLECVDLFEYLARVEMIPGQFGDVAPADSPGTVFYEDGDVQTRLEHLLTDAGLDEAWFVVFTGNVDVIETKYDPGDSILVALRDACDAEFPGIANCYTDKRGYFVFHGRQARFDPEGTAAGADWTFTRWYAGDGRAITLYPELAQIRPPLTPVTSRSRIYNAAIAWARGIDEADIPAQISTDPTSITKYGYRSKSMTDLIVGAGTTTGNTADQECKLFADFYVANYKDPRTRVEQVTFKAMDPDDDRAAATWALICNADISDIIGLEFTFAGSTDSFFSFLYIEGSTMTISPLNTTHDMVEVTFNVSPASAYGDDVGMLG